MVSKIREFAKMKQCQVRIPGTCNFNVETTVLAHLGGGGMGRKRNDIHGAHCCSSCHDVLDGRVPRGDWTHTDLRLMHFEGMVRTQDLLIEAGLI